MSQPSPPPFRADHVGSLLRPPELLAARAEFEADRIPADALREVEDRAVREVVRRQEELGLRSVTDGEFRRTTWYLDFIYRLRGIERGESVTMVPARKEGEVIDYAAPEVRIDGRIELGDTIFGDDFSFLRSVVTSATPKLSIPSPSMVTLGGTAQAAVARGVYEDVEQVYADLAAAYAEELRRLHRLGCTYLQIDDTTFAFVNDPVMRQRVAGEGGDPDRVHELHIRNFNRALAGRPEGMTVAVHMCRGNYRSAWFSQGGYDYVAEALFGQLQVDAFFLEYDDARSGSFEPLRFVPPDKIVVLGLVTTKHGELESKAALQRRIEEASRFVPLERLCLSPQCGFASTVEGNLLTQEQQWAKLELVVETAREVWG
ncbi:MAG TPA: 5-methyltetrahydropteroyltriglutamate--homocysteine S-methyltransferase [Candidatus Dormibacteraeota bacterium]|jgi:5-methyltetrahydropteroyltriglutamate--homocysteine methyltransferase|nr:5-methyltetrahydropteroyltriglutamate--homocysteine S-methyltransferase [Candidatus Dormibacteraeota bacterium]